MNCRFYLTLFVFSYSSGICAERQLKELRVGQTSFYMDTIPEGIDETKIKKHLDKMLEIHSKLKDIVPHLKKINTSNIKDTVSIVVPNKREYEYNHLDNLGITWLSFDNNDVVIKLGLQASGYRNVTREELKEYIRTRKVPSTYAAVTEEEAIALARKMHRLIYGKEEDKKFDSVRVTHSSRFYGVHFSVKAKNNIRDWRSSTVIINANSGEIESFSGEGLNKSITYDYTPKIPKSRAIEIFTAETERFHSDMKIKEIYLAKRKNDKDEIRWAWQIFGNRQGFMGTADVLYIDSENGEIIYNQIAR